MKALAFHVAEWLKKPRVEGPVTPADVAGLVDAQMWDGEYVRAQQLADDLTEHFMQHSGARSYIEFGRWLAVKHVLFIVTANENYKRAERSRRKARR